MEARTQRNPHWLRAAAKPHDQSIHQPKIGKCDAHGQQQDHQADSCTGLDRHTKQCLM